MTSNSKEYNVGVRSYMSEWSLPMHILPQTSLFGEDKFSESGDMERLKLVLDTIDDCALIHKLYHIRGKGRNDLPCEGM